MKRERRKLNRYQAENRRHRISRKHTQGCTGLFTTKPFITHPINKRPCDAINCTEEEKHITPVWSRCFCIFLAMYTICCHEVQIFSCLSDKNDSWVTKTGIKLKKKKFLLFCLNILLEK